MLVGAGSAHAQDEVLPLAPGTLEVVREPARVLDAATLPHRVSLGPGGSARLVVREIAARQLSLRIRRGRCRAPLRLVMRVDGRRVLERVIRNRRSRVVRIRVRLRGGDHRVDLVGARRAFDGCRPEARIDRIALTSARRDVPLGAAFRWSDAGEPAYRQTFLREFDSLTPENEMKMNYLRPTEHGFDWGPADQVVDFAQRTGKAVRGHPLIWGQQLPIWLTAQSFTHRGLEQILRGHISTVMGRYRGRVAEWDVVNEPMADDGTLASNVWSRGIGPSYVEAALRAARDADPDAKLFVNEIGTELSPRKFDGLLRLVADLKRRGVPLDGVGLQNHMHLDHYATRAVLADRMRRLAALGVEVQITEMDVSVTSDRIPRAQRDVRQAIVFGEAATACNEVPACTRFTTWGVGDRLSWLGPRALPLLFDGAWSPKPALRAVRRAFAPR